MGNILGIQFSGRLRRNCFWPTYIVLWVILGILRAISTNLTESSSISPFMMIVIARFHILASLYLILGGLGLGARRLHDTGRSAWWLLIGFVPFVGLILIAWYCSDSQPGFNQWGPNPKGLD